MKSEQVLKKGSHSLSKEGTSTTSDELLFLDRLALLRKEKQPPSRIQKQILESHCRVCQSASTQPLRPASLIFPEGACPSFEQEHKNPFVRIRTGNLPNLHPLKRGKTFFYLWLMSWQLLFGTVSADCFPVDVFASLDWFDLVAAFTPVGLFAASSEFHAGYSELG